MSKGSLFFGHARGKLGQIVLSTVKGQQVARAWQPKVANPRTTAQQIQRAKFANAVKFYRRATSNLFKFAYEDKRKTESDYNAFMRHNVDRSIILARSTYDNIAFPAIGYYWQMSAGSLGELSPVQSLGDNSSIRLSTIPLTGEKNAEEISISDASLAFINEFGAKHGDFVTFVTVKSGVDSINYDAVVAPQWSIAQIQIDVNDLENKLLTVLNSQAPNLGVTISKVTDNNIIQVSSSTAIWFAIIVSRVTSNGVLVSTSELVGNGVTKSIVDTSQQPLYRDMALTSWNRSSDPILKGSIAKSSKL